MLTDKGIDYLLSGGMKGWDPKQKEEGLLPGGCRGRDEDSHCLG